MKQIPLTQGKYALIDDEDIERVCQYKWHAAKKGNIYYAYTREKTKGRKTLSMHRLLMNTPCGMDTDHLDHNGLNNQKQNLRICTHQQNIWNSFLRQQNSSQFKGVHWHKRDKVWRSKITLGGKAKHIGTFKTEIEAALAYDSAARKLYGIFANVNFPIPPSTDSRKAATL